MNIFKIIKNKKGVTLIELVIYIGIAAFVMTTVLTFALNIIDGVAKSVSIQEVEYNSQFAIAKMRLDIQEADSINDASSVFDSDNGKLVLDSGGNTIVYELSNQVLTRIVDTNPSNNITNSKVNITQFRFEDRTVSGESENIVITITVDYRNPTNAQELETSKTVNTAVTVRGS